MTVIETKGEFGVIIERNIDVPMRDGTILRADVWRPDAEGRFPVLIERTPYDKGGSSESNLGAGEFYASHGYVVVIQDVRGRFASDGEFYPFRDDGDATDRRLDSPAKETYSLEEHDDHTDSTRQRPADRQRHSL